MGRIKDLDIDRLNQEAEWMGLLAELFQRKGFALVVREKRLADLTPDLEIEGNGEKIVVELKLHRSERVPLALVRNAFDQLDLMAKAGAHHGILVIPQRLVESHYIPVMRKQHELWGLDRLISEMQHHSELAADLAGLLRGLMVGAERQPEASSKIAELGDALDELPPPGAGTLLAEQLEALPPGKIDSTAEEYEKLCEQALRLLFGKDLLGWRSQSAIEHGFQRIDLVARLQPTVSAFWATLAAYFRTRYVIFEFKNYADPITQDQVYTTEKYLFTAALRAVAVIVAKNGANESASRAMRGALREQGKLILCLSMKEFCNLLRGFDAGNSPEDILIHKLDDLLVTIGR